MFAILSRAEELGSMEGKKYRRTTAMGEAGNMLGGVQKKS